ncbi:unnamed protein product [Gordionus sp. m RMFG-2023]
MTLPVCYNETSILVYDYIAYVLKKHGYSYLYVSDKESDSKEDVFEGLCVQLNIISVQTAYPSFVAVAKELFKDGGIKWGRITALFVFSGQLCLECINKDLPQLVGQIAIWLSQFVENNLSEWIDEQGGWQGYVEFYQKCPNIKSENTWPTITNFICGIAAGALGAITLKNWFNTS